MEEEQAHEALSKKEIRTAERNEREVAEKKKQMMTTALWVLVIVLFTGSLVVIAKFSGRSGGLVPELAKVSTQDHVKGNPESKAILVEYSDFQCPACGAMYPIIKQVVKESGDNVQLVYRQFPLISIHSNALPAARAAEAAGKQGKFWEMHDLLFEHQKDWEKANNPVDNFVGYARDLGLNEDQFRKDSESDEVKNKVDGDIVSGGGAGVNSTPTFFLNGKKMELTRNVNVEFFNKEIQAANQ